MVQQPGCGYEHEGSMLDGLNVCSWHRRQHLYSPASPICEWHCLLQSSSLHSSQSCSSCYAFSTTSRVSQPSTSDTVQA